MITQAANYLDEATPIRVLLADDDRAVLGVLHGVIRFLGQIVVGTAVNPNECIRRVDDLRPDVVLMDLTMAGGDGVATAETILNKSQVPVIITTGSSDQATFDRLEHADIAGYLAKPFKLESIKAAIESATSRATRDDKSFAPAEPANGAAAA